MNSVGADQDVRARRVRMATGAIEEISGDAALVLGERAEPAAGMDRVVAEALDDSLMNHALQTAAMNRELRHLMTGIEAALLVPDLLAVASEIEQLVGADRGVVEPV